MTPVIEILKTVRTSCDFDSVNAYPGDDEDERRTNFWLDVIETKSTDSGFGHLVHSIIDFGFVEGSSIGWDNGYLNEGHHRIVAAILLGLDEVPTSKWGSNKDVKGEHISGHWNDDGHPIYLDF